MSEIVTANKLSANNRPLPICEHAARTMVNEQRRSSQALCNIDFLRGIAAFVILFWHYQHFYFPRAGVNAVVNKRSIQPLFDFFSWFYLHGSWAVQFFWMLSGFIFFHVYAQRVDVSLKDFFVNRFSRLYPLHLITLITVALLQTFSWMQFGHFQIYPFNNGWHFFLNILMASHWGFQNGYSFNAPIWSVSVEILVYVMFFAFLRSFRIRLLTSVLWLAWSVMFYKNSSGAVFECGVFFALGGVVNQAHAWLHRRSMLDLSFIGAMLLLILAIAAVKFEITGYAEGVKFGLFPALIWLAAALEEKGFSSGVLGLRLGSVTYSSYLLHIPIQIIIIMFLDGVIGGRNILSSPYFLGSYILGVFSIASLAYRFVELPLKIKCRQLFG